MPKPNINKPSTGNPKRREPMTAADVAYNKRMTPDVQQTWVDACMDSSRLTTWEQKFVQSLLYQLNNDKRLSERQVEILERIYNEKV